MRRFTSFPRQVLLTLAVLLAAVIVTYSVLWMQCVRWRPQAYLGIDYSFSALFLLVTKVFPGTAAEQAGLQAGDRIVAMDGRELETREPFYDSVARGRPGNTIRMLVERPGSPKPLALLATLHPPPATPRRLSLLEALSDQLIKSFPFWLVVVSLPVLFLRLQDRNAWLLTLLFAGIISGAPLLALEPAIEPHFRGFAWAYKVIFNGTFGSIFNYFFAVFPVPSFLDRRFPWLKKVSLGFALLICVPLGCWALLANSPEPLLQLGHRLGITTGGGIFIASFLFPVTLGLVSLVGNGFFAAAAEVRRKIRVIVWGTLAGLLPGVFLYTIPTYFGKGTQAFPAWVWGLISLLGFWLFPLSFAYAVVKHRVLEIPVLLKRSARFLLVQWGVHILGLLATVTLALLLGLTFSKVISAHPEISVLPAIALGGLILWLGIVVGGRVNKRIDRAFFRSAYDARLILENLAERTRTATTRQQLAMLLEEEIRQALHPQSMVMYQRAGDRQLCAVASEVLQEPQSIPADLPLLVDLAHRGHPWEVPPPDAGLAPALATSLSAFAPLQPECLVPMLGRESQLAGLLVLGPRLSEEPYSREDRRLLASVASQAGVALEGIRLTERMAERMEAERRSLHEVEMARQVQARLFPQKLPSLRTLEYAGRCIQARQVGGDYYDFLELAPGRLGLLLADIAGKGFSGALLMANLQANLRSQYAAALEDLPRLLESVNRLFYGNTADEAYATLFFTDYDDATGHMRYANCGHVSPLLLRADGTPEWLESTCTVLGLFEKWQCRLGQVELASKDTLVLYSDGVTEAAGADGEEFGQVRLLDTVRSNKEMAASSLLEAIVAAVQNYSGQEQADDLTLVVARGR